VPFWAAAIEQVPAPAMVTSPEATVHTLCVVDVSVTFSPALLVALIAKGATPKVVSLIGLKVIVCCAGLIAKLRFAETVLLEESAT
jgi:hypothetical protein